MHIPFDLSLGNNAAKSADRVGDPEIAGSLGGNVIHPGGLKGETGCE